jgi:hypothetical protein
MHDKINTRRCVMRGAAYRPTPPQTPPQRTCTFPTQIGPKPPARYTRGTQKFVVVWPSRLMPSFDTVPSDHNNKIHNAGKFCSLVHHSIVMNDGFQLTACLSVRSSCNVVLVKFRRATTPLLLDIRSR